MLKQNVKIFFAMPRYFRCRSCWYLVPLGKFSTPTQSFPQNPTLKGRGRGMITGLRHFALLPKHFHMKTRQSSSLLHEGHRLAQNRTAKEHNQNLTAPPLPASLEEMLPKVPLPALRKPRATHALWSPPLTSISGSPQTLRMSPTQRREVEV